MITIKDGKFHTNGKRWNLLLGVSAFKLGNLVATGRRDEALEFIAHMQSVLGRKEVAFRVLLENGGWSPIPAGTGMFGSPPQDPGMWDHEWLSNHWDAQAEIPRRVKPEHVRQIYKDTLRWFFQTSAATGAVFELVIIATLKHTDGVGNGHMDHIIRNTLILGDDYQAIFPDANVIMSACNEWDAHKTRKVPYSQDKEGTITRKGVRMWAVRRARDNYWKDKPLIVDHGGRDTFEYECGPEREKYDAGMVHPVRKNSGRDWRELPNMERLRADARGMPVGFTESMFLITRPETAGWYRNTAGWNMNISDQMLFYSRWENNIDYGIIHADYLVQCDQNWGGKQGRFESELSKMFGGSVPPPPPKLLYERIIRMAYTEILGRDPDEGGLTAYNDAMVQGFTEGQLRESLIRSDEYRQKNS